MADRALKILCVFFLLSVFIFSGCGEKSGGETAAVNADFSADFEAEYNQMKIKGTLSSTRQGMTNINVEYPESLKGLGVRYKNSEVIISRENLECSADEAYIPDGSFPNIVHSVLKGIGEGRYGAMSENDGILTYSLKTPQGSCVFTADSEGNLIKAEIKSLNFSISFLNVKAALM